MHNREITRQSGLSESAVRQELGKLLKEGCHHVMDFVKSEYRRGQGIQRDGLLGGLAVPLQRGLHPQLILVHPVPIERRALRG